MNIGVLLRYLVLLLALVIYAGGCSTDVMQSFYRTELIPDDYRFGDLYRLANLPQFKARQHPCPTEPPANEPDSAKSHKPIHFYIIGDSFSEPQRLSINDFPVAYYKRVKWDFDQRVELDTTKNNVLLIETVERHFRNHFDLYIDDIHVVPDTNQPEPPARVDWRQRIRQWEEGFSSAAVESRLETILFFYDWALWFKELKARITQDWFGRADAKVSVSPDGKHLLYYLDTDTSKVTSSFTPLPDTLLNRYVDSVNVVAARYKRLGFAHVMLAIIPNKTTIEAPSMGPLPYNHLIERLQQHPALQVPTVNVYAPFKAHNGPLYEISDAHWNCEGRRIWIQAVRQELARQTRPQ